MYQRIGSILACTALLLVGLVTPSQASPTGMCPWNLMGDGTESHPWLIHNVDEFICFDLTSNILPPFNSTTTYIQLADNLELTSDVWDSSHRIARRNLSTVFDGGGYSISVNGISGFNGLFLSYPEDHFSNLQVRNLILNATNSSLQDTTAWIINYVEDGTFDNITINASADCLGCAGIATYAQRTNVTNSTMTGSIGVDGGGLIGPYSKNISIVSSTSTGSIGNAGGGLVGRGAENVSIVASSSSGHIGEAAGGLVGQGSKFVTIRQSFSTGDIDINGGGLIGAIVGPFIQGDTSDTTEYANISESYSTGTIGKNAGGLVGAAALGVKVTNTFSTGALLGDYSGGIIGSGSINSTVSNSYSTGALIGNTAGGIVATDTLNFLGTNLYSSGIASPNTRGISGDSEVDNGILDNDAGTTVNSYSEANNGNTGIFNLANAYRVLQIGDNSPYWGYCATVTPSPLYLKAFYGYDNDPCQQPCNDSSCQNNSGGGDDTSTASVCKISAVVHFAGNSARLTTATKKHLKKVAREIKQKKCRKISLAGYSANPYYPSKKIVGVKLSRLRVKAVSTALKRNLVSLRYQATIKISWHGSRHPVATNKTLKGQKSNRRVVILALKRIY